MGKLKNLHCFYLDIFNGTYVGHFVRKEGAPEGPREAHSKLSPAEEARKEEEKLNREFLRGRGTAWAPNSNPLSEYSTDPPLKPTPKPSASSDGTPPPPTIDELTKKRESIDPKNEARLKDELQKIKDKELPDDVLRKFSGPFIDQYRTLVNDFDRFILFQAIVENGTEAALLENYTKSLQKIKAVAERSTNPSMFWDTMHGIFVDIGISDDTWLTKAVDWKNEGENLYLTERNIKPKNRGKMEKVMKEMEEYYTVKFKEKNRVYLGRNKYDDTALEFVKDSLFPFYRELFLNRAIVANHSPEDLAKEYPAVIKKYLRVALSSQSILGKQDDEETKTLKEKSKEEDKNYQTSDDPDWEKLKDQFIAAASAITTGGEVSDESELDVKVPQKSNLFWDLLRHGRDNWLPF